MTFSSQSFKRPACPTLAALGCALALTLVGCDREEEIQAFRVPKDQKAAPATMPAMGSQAMILPEGHPPVTSTDAPLRPPAGSLMMNMPGAGAIQAPQGAGQRLAFTTPVGWRADAQPMPPRVASFQAGDPAAPVLITVTVFPGNVGGVVANLNRWRGEVGLPPIAAVSEQETQAVQVAGAQAFIVDLNGKDARSGGAKRTLAALIARPEETWFVKTSGQPEAIGKQKEAFELFVKSVEFAGGN